MKHYWIVVCADNENYEPSSGPSRVPEYLRIAHGKFETPEEACANAFGRGVSSHMWVKDCGTSIKALRTDKTRRELCDIDKGVWMRLGSHPYSAFVKGPRLYWIDGKFKGN